MSKRKFFIPLAALSLLFSSVVACNGGGNSNSQPVGSDSSSEPAGLSSSSAPQAEGYAITFVAEHCQIFYYEDADYTVEPIAVTGPVQSRDSDGNISKYVAADPDNGISEVKPQINFKIVCESGYAVDATCITVSGTKGEEWNKLESPQQDVYKITKIKADLTVTVTAVDPIDLVAGYEVTFELTHCTVKVYKGKKDETGSNIDEGPKYYSRNKTTPETLDKGKNAQFNFEVIPESGYQFIDGLEWGTNSDAEYSYEVEAKNVGFIRPARENGGTFNKIKKNAVSDNNGPFNLTQINGPIIITLTCVAAA